MEKINLSNLTLGSSITITSTTTFRVPSEGVIQADSTARKTTSGLSGNPKSEEVIENYSYNGTPDQVKNGITADGHTGDLLETNTL